mgnify:CR=1 FL=1
MESIRFEYHDLNPSEVDQFIQIMLTNPNLLRDLHLVHSLGLPEACIAAGYVRNYIWDYLHGYTERTPLHDVDVLYYDPHDLRIEIVCLRLRAMTEEACSTPEEVVL